MIIKNLKELKAFLQEASRGELEDNARREKAHQQRTISKIGAVLEQDEQPEAKPAAEAPAEPSKTVASDAATDIDDVSVEDVISQLNALRSGKSLKDETVKANFVEYFDSLKKAERVALQTFLKGISQVLTGEIPGEAAPTPHEPPADLKMKKVEQVTIKPTVVSKGSPTKPTSQKPAEVKPPIEPKQK